MAPPRWPTPATTRRIQYTRRANPPDHRTTFDTAPRPRRIERTNRANTAQNSNRRLADGASQRRRYSSVRQRRPTQKTRLDGKTDQRPARSARPNRTQPGIPQHRQNATYQRQRVEAAEQHPTFIQHLNKSANRRRTAAKASQHRRNDTIRWAAETPIHWVCPTQSFDELRAASRINSDHYDADQQCIDFVINHCSDFQAAAAQAYGMTGKSQATAVLITRICKELSQHWPQLRNACERRIIDDLSE